MASVNPTADQISFLLEQALIAQQQGNLPLAEQAITAVLTAHPAHADALNLRGTMAYLQQNYAAAAADQAKAVKAEPNYAPYRNNYGMTLRRLQKRKEAEQQFLKAISLEPQDPMAYANLGRMLYEDEDEFKRAEPYLQKALQRAPANESIRRAYAACLFAQSKYKQAIAEYEQLAAHALDIDALEALATAYYATGNRQGADESSRKILQLSPQSARAHYIQGCLFMDKSHTRDGISAFQAAIRHDPNHFEARQRLIDALFLEKKFMQGHEHLQYLLAKPEYARHPVLLAQKLRYYNSIGDLPAIIAEGNFLRQDFEISEHLASAASLTGLVMAEDEATCRRLFDIQRVWAKTFDVPDAKPLCAHSWAQRHRPLRVALLSADFRDHSVGKFLLSLIQNAAPELVDFNCYSLMAAPSDQIYRHFQSIAKNFVDLQHQSGDDVAKRIAADGNDILIELNGMTYGGCPQILAQRVAPVQMSWLGYPFSTGFGQADYILVDQFLCPENTNCMTERPLILKDSSYLCYAAAEPRPIGALPLQRVGGQYVMFGSQNNPYKLGLRTADLWRRVLKEVPKSRLVHIHPEFRNTQLAANLRKYLAGDDIDPNRIYLRENYAEHHLDQYNDIDICLDTFPVTGGTTTMESIWMGVPVISRFGAQIHQRVSYSILQNAGLGDLCAASDDEYVEIAKTLAANPARLLDLRQNLRSRLEQTSLVDTKKFADAFVQTLLSIA
jgi:protein O-GlcNAc transferase